MSKPIKTIFFVIIGFMALVASVAAGLLVFVDINDYRIRVETTASKALGMDVRITGSLAIDLWSGLHISMKDVHIAQQGAEVASVEEVRLGIDLLPLLQNKLNIRGSFQDPQVEKPNFIKSLAGPVVKVLELGKELLPGGECEPFYAGSVALPK